MYVTKENYEEARDILSRELENVATWFDSNKLTLNVDKTKLMFLSRRGRIGPRQTISLRQQELECIHETKFLGVLVDERLNWKAHIQMINSKISKSCGIIYRIKDSLNNQSKKLLYYSLIHPYLNYCINIWSSTFKTHYMPLLKGQKRILRIFFSANRRTHTVRMFEEYRILPINQLITYPEGIIAHKLISGSVEIPDFFLLNNANYNLRNNNNFRLPQNVSTQTQIFIKTRAIKTWNALPNDIRFTPTLNSFKNKLKTHLLFNYVEENREQQ